MPFDVQLRDPGSGFSVLLSAGAPPIGNDGYLPVWNGTDWVLKPANAWTGSAWTVKPASYWNGTEWVVVGGSSGPSNSGPVELLGVQALSIGAGSTGTASITIPAGATHYVCFWHFWSDNGETQVTSITCPALANATLGAGNRNGGGNETGAGIGYGSVNSTGSETLTVNWNEAVELGPSFCIAFLSGGAVTSASVLSGTWQSATLGPASVTSDANGVVLIFNAKIDAPTPNLIAGTTSEVTGSASGGWYASGFRLASAPGQTGNVEFSTGTAYAYPALIVVGVNPV